MAFKRSAVRSRLSPPRTRTHVAERYMSSCSILIRSKSGYLIQIKLAENELPHRFIGHCRPNGPALFISSSNLFSTHMSNVMTIYADYQARSATAEYQTLADNFNGSFEIRRRIQNERLPSKISGRS